MISANFSNHRPTITIYEDALTHEIHFAYKISEIDVILKSNYECVDIPYFVKSARSKVNHLSLYYVFLRRPILAKVSRICGAVVSR